MSSFSSRRGFALLTVLWVMVAASIVSLATTIVARDAVGAARNRIDSDRALWLASGCVQRALARIDAALADARERGASRALWQSLDRAIGLVAVRGECEARLEAVGARLDLNAADTAVLAALFRRLGVADHDRLGASVQAWRDTNGAIPHMQALSRIEGLPDSAMLNSLLWTEPGRVSINHASLTVLGAIPGITDEVLARIAIEREAGRPIEDLRDLADLVSSAARTVLLANAELAGHLTTTVPDGWMLHSTGEVGSPPASATIDVRIMLDRAGASVTTWRSRQ